MFTQAQMGVHDRGYQDTGAVQVPTIRNHGEVECRQGRHSTFGNLPKTYPTLWISCAHYNCMTVYDVTNANDTQRNLHLTDHHSLDVKTIHDHKDLHTAREDTFPERNTTDLSGNMIIVLLVHLRVARYFIRKMCPFSQCEDTSYHEQAPSD